MKKLLGLFGAIGLISSSGVINVISCDQEDKIIDTETFTLKELPLTKTGDDNSDINENDETTAVAVISNIFYQISVADKDEEVAKYLDKNNISRDYDSLTDSSSGWEFNNVKSFDDYQKWYSIEDFKSFTFFEQPKKHCYYGVIINFAITVDKKTKNV